MHRQSMPEAEIRVEVCSKCDQPAGDLNVHVCGQPPASIADPYVGVLINGRFRIQAPIGIGGWSVVYRALDEQLQRTVAVKLLHLPLANDEDKRKRFENEAKAASRLSHPNIVATYDYGITPVGQPFIVMEYLQGESLAERIKRLGRVTFPVAVDVCAQAAEGLAYAHLHNVLHRDIKPSNLFITEDSLGGCTVKLVDFGLAKTVGGAGDLSELTATGQTLGSPAYMSPEQCMGEKLDPSSDVYSLAISLYEAIAGVKPFSGNPLECMSAHVSNKAPSFSAIDDNLKVPAALERAIASGMAKRREERLPSARAFCAAIKSGAQGEAPRGFIGLKVVRAWQSRRARWLRWAVRAIVYGAICYVGYFEFAEPAIMHAIGVQEPLPTIKSDHELAAVLEGMEPALGIMETQFFAEEALNYRMRRFGAESPAAGAAAFLLANLYDKQQQPELALFYYRYAAKCLRSGHDGGAYAEALSCFAERALTSGRLPDAKRAASDLEDLEIRQYGKGSEQAHAAGELKRQILDKIASRKSAR